MTFEKVGAWAITEPDAGSDAFGGMRTTVRRDGDEWVLNGQKTFITNGPFADTIVVYAKHDDGTGGERRDQPVLTFVLDSGMAGLAQSGPLRKMGMHSSPTGQLFFDEVRLGDDRLLGSATDGAGARALGPTSWSNGSGSPPGARRDRGVPAPVRRLRAVARALGPADR